MKSTVDSVEYNKALVLVHSIRPIFFSSPFQILSTVLDVTKPENKRFAPRLGPSPSANYWNQFWSAVCGIHDAIMEEYLKIFSAPIATMIFDSSIEALRSPGRLLLQALSSPFHYLSQVAISLSNPIISWRIVYLTVQ